MFKALWTPSPQRQNESFFLVVAAVCGQAFFNNPSYLVGAVVIAAIALAVAGLLVDGPTRTRSVGPTSFLPPFD